MRNLSATIINRLKENISFLCKAWEFKRSDGLIINLTEHDENLIINGKTYNSINPIESGHIETEYGLGSDRAQISGAFNSPLFDETEILLGLWNNAEVSLYIIDWQLKTEIANIWNGYVKNIYSSNWGFEFELTGIEDKLNQLITQKYTRHCSAEFGDNKCGKTINSLEINIASIDRDNISFAANQSLENYENGEIAFYYNGILTPKLKIKELILENNIAVLKLENSLRFAPNIETARIYEGCDKSIQKCKFYNNFENFRGFPHMPGEGIIYKGPNQ